MPLSERDNYLRNATFRRPEWIPVGFYISNAAWDQLRQDLEAVLAQHPTLFPDFVPGQRDFDHFEFGPAHTAGEDYTDAWGCLWRAAINGLEGVVARSPLSDWEKLASYQAPDPAIQWDRGPADWEGARKQVAEARAKGNVARGGVPHGFLFLRLTYLRGFENLMLDIASQAPELDGLIEKVMTYNRGLVERWLALGVDVMELADDLGTQKAAAISPAHFRRYLAPHYRSLVEASHAQGALVGFHSDGYIMDIMDELLATGIDIINPQDLLNGVEDLARAVKGRACIRLDIDRQKIVPYGSRAEIRDLIEYEVRTLGSPLGGLELICGIYPPTPAENVDAVCSAIEEFRTFWWDGRG
ncbi:MAG: uroporphyrinogen decarboxylase family protein, partial [Anaerolineae bacterium]